jgi:hypothetical protein
MFDHTVLRNAELQEKVVKLLAEVSKNKENHEIIMKMQKECDENGKYMRKLAERNSELRNKLKEWQLQWDAREEKHFAACKIYYTILKDALELIKYHIPKSSLMAELAFWKKHGTNIAKIKIAGKKYED